MGPLGFEPASGNAEESRETRSLKESGAAESGAGLAEQTSTLQALAATILALGVQEREQLVALLLKSAPPFEQGQPC
jgi:hypothetical protein